MTSTSWLHRQKVPRYPDEHTQLLQSMYMSPADIEQFLLRQQMLESSRRFGGRSFGSHAAFQALVQNTVPGPGSGLGGPSHQTNSPPLDAMPTTAAPKPPPPPFMLATDRRAMERAGPMPPANSSILDEPSVLMPDEYVHPEAKWKCLIRADTILDMDSMQRAKQKKCIVELDEKNLQLEALLAEEDDPLDDDANNNPPPQSEPYLQNNNLSASSRRSSDRPIAPRSKRNAPSRYLPPSTGGSSRKRTTAPVQYQSPSIASPSGIYANIHSAPTSPRTGSQYWQQHPSGGLLPKQTPNPTPATVKYSAVGVPVSAFKPIQEPSQQQPQSQTQLPPSSSSTPTPAAAAVTQDSSRPPTSAGPPPPTVLTPHWTTSTPNSAVHIPPSPRSTIIQSGIGISMLGPNESLHFLPKGSDLNGTPRVQLHSQEEKCNSPLMGRISPEKMHGRNSPMKSFSLSPEKQSRSLTSSSPSSTATLPTSSPNDSDLQQQLRELQQALQASQLQTQQLTQRIAQLEASAPNPTSLPPIAHRGEHDEKTASLTRALSRQSVDLRRERRSLTDEKVKLMNQQLELAKAQEQILKEQTELEHQRRKSLSQAPLPPTGLNPRPPSHSRSGSISAGEVDSTMVDDHPANSMVRALAKQNAALKSSRKSLTEEKLRLMNEVVKQQSEKDQIAKEKEELEQKLGNSDSNKSIRSPSPSPTASEEEERLAALQRASLQQLTRLRSQRASARNSLNLDKDELMKRTLELESMKSTLAEERLKFEQEQQRLKSALEKEAQEVKLMREQVASQQHSLTSAQQSSASSDATIKQLRSELDKEKHALANEKQRTKEINELSQELQDAKSLIQSLQHQTMASQNTNQELAELKVKYDALKSESDSVHQLKQQLLSDQQLIEQRLSELEAASRAVSEAAANQQEQDTMAELDRRQARAELEAELMTLRQQCMTEMQAQRAALEKEIIDTRAAFATRSAEIHNEHSRLWTQERENLLKLFEADCEEVRRNLATEHHLFVSKERAELKSASVTLERDRARFEEAKRRFKEGHPGFSERPIHVKQASLSNQPQQAAPMSPHQPHSLRQRLSSTHAPDHRLAHQASTAASLAKLSAAIEGDRAGLHDGKPVAVLSPLLTPNSSFQRASPSTPDSPATGAWNERELTSPKSRVLSPRSSSTVSASPDESPRA